MNIFGFRKPLATEDEFEVYSTSNRITDVVRQARKQTGKDLEVNIVGGTLVNHEDGSHGIYRVTKNGIQRHNGEEIRGGIFKGDIEYDVEFPPKTKKTLW